MWGAIGAAVLQHLPALLQFAEQLLPGPGKGSEKKLTVTSKMVEYEGALALDQSVKVAKSTLVDAQVAYLNALETAAAEARQLGIILPQVAGSDSGSLPKLVAPVATKPTTNAITTSALDAVTRAG